jgi:hypothetical protein
MGQIARGAEHAWRHRDCAFSLGLAKIEHVAS